MKARLGKRAIAVAHVANDDPDSPILKSVCIKDGEILATDGFILAKHKIETEGKAVLLNAKDILAFYQTFVKTGSLAISASGGDEAVIMKSSGASMSLKIRGGQDKYPDLEKPYEHFGKPRFDIALSVKTLKKLLELAGDSILIRFRFRDSYDPVEFVTDSDSYGLVMPFNMPGESELWHKWQKEEEQKASQAGDTTPSHERVEA